MLRLGLLSGGFGVHPVGWLTLAGLEQIGAACLEFHQALEALYLRSVAGKNLLRNKPLLAP